MRAVHEVIRMYFLLLQIALKSMLQFNADFLIGVVGIFFMNGVNLLAIGVILGRFTDLAGWTIWQIVFLFGVWMTGNSLYSLLFYHLADLEEYIVDGAFDRFLVRPISPLIQILTVDVNINGIGDVLFGAACLASAMLNLNLHFSALQWLYLSVMLVSAALIELGITLSIGSIAFWTTRSASLIYAVNMVNWQMTQQYPLEMFGRGFRVLVTCIIPVAFINYYPARFLLSKTAPGDPWYFLSFMSPAIAVGLVALSVWIWSKGMRHYNSTGS